LWDTSSVTDMTGMFDGASLFQQDISTWCVEQIPETPADFDSNAGFEGQTELQPNWGVTCADTFAVSDLQAPEQAAPGESINVSATITNTGTDPGTQLVEFQFNGTELANTTETLNASESTLVEFSDISLPSEEGTFEHGISTANDSETATIQLEDPGLTEISTWTDLNDTRANLSGDYVLVNDLNRSTPGYEQVAGPDANGGNGFDPIGGFNERFTGIFDGQGQTIRDFVINRPGEDFIGLFGATGTGGTVMNVSVTNATVTGEANVGGLVGGNVGTVTGSQASASVTGSGSVGGLVGQNLFNSIVTESQASGPVTGENFVGGLVGFNLGNVTGTQASGSVTGTGDVGGLVGQHRQGTLSESFAVGGVAGSADAGGLVGQLGSPFLNPGVEAIVRNGYFDNQTTGQSTAVGTIEEGNGTAETGGEVTGILTSGMRGESAAMTMSTLDFQTTWRTVTSPDYYPALRAVTAPATFVVSNLTAPAEATPSGEIDVTATVTNVGNESGTGTVEFRFDGTALTNTTETLNASESTLIEFSNIQLPNVAGTFEHGIFTADDGETAIIQVADPGPTEISTWTDLNNTRANLSGDYVLVNDLNKSTPGYNAVVANKTATEFSEIEFGSFKQGDEVTLARTPLDSVTATNATGASVNVTITDAANGTVEFQENATDGISSITFDYATAEEKFVGFDPIGSSLRFTGMFDGQGGTVADLRINRPTEDQAGLFGATGTGGTVTNVSVINATVTGTDKVGGLVGGNDGTVTESAANGSVNGSEDIGGLVGINDEGNVTGSQASGSVNGSEGIGGLVGANNGNVTGSQASGSVNGSEGIGGLVGINDEGNVTESAANGSVNGSEGIGGLVGINDEGNVTESAASGQVTGENRAGGLVGWNLGTVANGFATGDVTGENRTGGLVGSNEGAVTASYAVGTVDGNGTVGGLVGTSTGETSDAYWDTVLTGQSDGVGDGGGDVTGFDPAEMQGSDAADNMTALDFVDTWETVTADDSDAEFDGYPVLRTLDREQQLDRQPAFLQILTTNAPDEVPLGGTLDIVASAENVGAARGVDNLTLSVDATEGVQDELTAPLDPGQAALGTLTFGTVADLYEVGETIEWTVELDAFADSVSGETAVVANGSFAVNITGTTAPVVEGEALTVDAQIENTGEVEGIRTVTLDVGPLGSNSTNVILGGNDSTNLTLSVPTASGDAGEYTATATVAGGNDADSTAVTVLVDANFTVAITNVDEEVTEGETVGVDYEVTNTGGAGDTQTITFAVEGGTEDTETGVTLNPSETFVGAFTYETGEGDAPGIDVTVESADDAVTGEVVVDLPGSLQLDSIDHPDEVPVEGALEVEYTVENVGEREGTESSIRLSTGDGSVVDSDANVTVAPGETATGTLVYDDIDEAYDPGETVEFDVELEAYGDVRTGTAEVAAGQPTFDVSQFGVDFDGGTVTAVYTIENVGLGTDTQTVEFLVDGEPENSTTETLEPGATADGLFVTDIEETDEVTVGLATETDSAAETLEPEPSAIVVDALAATFDATTGVVEIADLAVANAGEFTGERTLTLTANGVIDGETTTLREATTAVTVAPGESTAVGAELFTAVGVPDPDIETVVITLDTGDTVTEETVETAGGPDPASFTLSNLTFSGTVATGESLTVSVAVENTGEQSGAATVELSVGEASDDRTVTLPAGGTEAVTFDPVNTADLGPGEYQVGVSTPDDDLVEMLVVEPAPEASLSGLDVAGQGPNATVTADTAGTVTADVANNGSAQATVTVDLAIEADDGTVVVSESTGVTVDGGVTEAASFDGVTADLDPGEYGVTVTTDSDTLTGSLSVVGADAPARLRVEPSAVVFGEIPAGDTATRTVIVENVGGESLSLERVALGEDGAFDLAAGAVENTLVLEPGETREATVEFAPTDEAATVAYLFVESSVPSDERLVPVSGGAAETTASLDEQERATVNATVRNVSAGEQATVNLPDPVAAERYRTETVSVTPAVDADVGIEVTTSSRSLPTTPGVSAGFPNNTTRLGNVSAETTVDDDAVESVAFTATVDRDHLSSVGAAPEDVTFYQFDETAGIWEARETELVEVTNEAAVLRVTADGFSEWTAVAERPSFNITRTDAEVTTATADEIVDIEVAVENSGGADGTYVADLLLDDDVVASEEAIIAEGGEELFLFERSIEEPGTYEVQVNQVFVATVEVTAGNATVDGGPPADDDDGNSNLPPDDDNGDDEGEGGDDGFGTGFGWVTAVLALLAVGSVLYSRRPTG